jgi:hypothetical protein
MTRPRRPQRGLCPYCKAVIVRCQVMDTAARRSKAAVPATTLDVYLIDAEPSPSGDVQIIVQGNDARPTNRCLIVASKTRADAMRRSGVVMHRRHRETCQNPAAWSRAQFK